MYEASTPAELLMPADLAQPRVVPAEDHDPLVLRPHRAPRAFPSWMTGFAAAAAVLLVAIPIIVLAGQERNVSAPTAPSSTTVTQTLYADGDIRDCPDNFASDTSSPVGEVNFTPVSGGVMIEISLEGAAPDWVYVVHVFKETPTSDPCALGLDTLTGLTTNADGDGQLTQVVPLFSGEHAIGVNITYDTIDPPDQPLREIAPQGYAIITVPEPAP